MSITGREWDVFLSYSHRDCSKLAQPVADLLDRRGVRVFIDDVELLVGDVLVERLSTAVHGSRYFVALISPAYLQSGWCRQEVVQMLTREANANEVGILPFQVAGCAIPPQLATRRYKPLRGEEDEASEVVTDILAVLRRDYSEGAGIRAVVNAPVWVERMCELSSLARRCTTHLLRGDQPEVYAQNLEDIYYEIATIRTRYTAQIDPEYYDLFEQLQNGVFRGTRFPQEERERIERTHRQLLDLTQKRYGGGGRQLTRR